MSPTTRALSLVFVTAAVAGACNFLSSGTGQQAGGLANLAGGIACPALASGGDALSVQYTAQAALNAKVGAFVQAAKDLQRLSVQMDAEVTEACRKIGADIGVDAAAMQPRQDATASQAACGAVSAKVKGLLQGGVKLEASYTPPKCHVDASASAGCDARCKVDVDPGEIVAQCTPAKLSGRCQGTCKGQCDGKCSGQCNGNCAVKDAQGKCAGKCEGTCQGKCDATCHASCEGSWQAPKCEGHVTPPKVDADCKASCQASVKFKAQCTKPQLDLKASSNAQALGKLLASLSVHMPALLVAQVKIGKEIGGEVQTLVRLGGELRGKLKGAGERAIACVTASASAVATASVSINVSFKASASVSGAAGVSAGG
jgi:hypothetical protein